jgi:hypothetical protein
MATFVYWVITYEGEDHSGPYPTEYHALQDLQRRTPFSVLTALQEGYTVQRREREV